METFSALLAICAGNSPVPGEFPHKGQWRGALMFSLICIRIKGWVNNDEARDLRRHRAHYDVTIMHLLWSIFYNWWFRKACRRSNAFFQNGWWDCTRYYDTSGQFMSWLLRKFHMQHHIAYIYIHYLYRWITLVCLEFLCLYKFTIIQYGGGVFGSPSIEPSLQQASEIQYR